MHKCTPPSGDCNSTDIGAWVAVNTRLRVDVCIYVSGKYIGNTAQANIMESTVLSTSAVGRAGSIRTNRQTLKEI